MKMTDWIRAWPVYYLKCLKTGKKQTTSDCDNTCEHYHGGRRDSILCGLAGAEKDTELRFYVYYKCLSCGKQSQEDEGSGEDELGATPMLWSTKTDKKCSCGGGLTITGSGVS